VLRDRVNPDTDGEELECGGDEEERSKKQDKIKRSQRMEVKMRKMKADMCVFYWVLITSGVFSRDRY